MIHFLSENHDREPVTFDCNSPADPSTDVEAPRRNKNSNKGDDNEKEKGTKRAESADTPSGEADFDGFEESNMSGSTFAASVSMLDPFSQDTDWGTMTLPVWVSPENSSPSSFRL